MKKIVIPILILAVIATIGFTLLNNKAEIEARAEQAMVTNEFVPVTVETVAEKPLQIRFETNGVFEADQELLLKSEAQGTVVAIQKRKGDAVAVGDLIARLDDTLLQADLKVAKANLVKSERDLERFKNLAATDAITGRQLEDAELGFESANAQVASLEKRISDMRIVAPIAGILNEDYLEIGAFLNVGGNVAEIVKARPLKLSVTVSESDVLRISRGDEVSVYSSADRSQKLRGTVQFIALKADGQLRYPVEIRVNDAGDIKPGMFGYAEFQSSTTTPVKVISRKSIATSLKDPQVFVVEGDRVSLRSIQIRPIDSETVEVLSGLELGENVVRTGHINLRDGSAVQVAQ